MNAFQQTWSVRGALAADHTFKFKAFADLQLIHASAVNSSANAGTLKIGSSSDDDAYLEAFAFGVSGAPSQAGRSDFVNDQFPHISSGATVVVTVSDHASHMANADVVLTFTLG